MCVWLFGWPTCSLAWDGDGGGRELPRKWREEEGKKKKKAAKKSPGLPRQLAELSQTKTEALHIAERTNAVREKRGKPHPKS